MPATSYELAVDTWTDTDSIEITSTSNLRIASFPLSFVQTGGDNTWRYVLEVVGQLVEKDSDQLDVIMDEHGVAVSLDDAPSSGMYHYEQTPSSGKLEFSRGPEYFSRFRPVTPEGSFSTRSDSKGSSDNQFRMGVVARDGTCLVTDVMHSYCTSCHIVPLSRPDVYQLILGINRDPPLYKTSAGLLVRDDLHHAYDRLEWSLYYKDGSFYVHFFVLGYPDATRLHGMRIPPERFRGPISERPDPRLVQWHYAQCVKARIRGFAAGMEFEP
ncbi:hypothetical protein C362_05351 [Cryptococcus neoformans Bt1]|nr:hypothetical protein C362_05351 [Cryptococcus neoformans var. grubii Bt1]